MKSRQAGFTMIELIVVIVILGILAATALPKFIDMRGDAQAAALKGVIGAAGSAMNVNYSGCAVVNNVATAATAKKCQQVSNCADVGKIMQGGFPLADFSVAATAIGTGVGSNGDEADCTVTQTVGGATATFKGVSAGN